MLKETERINELKSHLLDLVNSSNDEEKLVKATKILNKEKEDWWDELPVAQQKRITKALKNVEAGKRLVNHEEVFSTLKQKSKNRKKQ